MSRCLVILSALVLAALAIPSAAAQPAPTIRINVKWAVDHEMVLPDSGRADMGTVVEVLGEDFVCAQDFRFKVRVGFKDPLEKWAGASIVPELVPQGNNYFLFEAGKPGLKQGGSAGTPAKNSGNVDANLNIAWNLDERPAIDAKHAYRVYGEFKPEAGASACTSSGPRILNEPSEPMVVRMLDKPTKDEMPPDSQRCLDNPLASGCAAPTTPPTEGGGSWSVPGPGPALLAIVLCGAVMLRRRR